MQHFRISSALKSIIGKDLITDDFIAVFELVKNSFDANAKRVDIYFETDDEGKPRIVVSDNGEGMSKNDILNKYLFVAYSEKKDEKSDYRHKIEKRRIQAGAKGIGRFSCDRIGNNLKLFSKTEGATSWQVVEIDWKRFESDMKDEFANIPVKLSTSKLSPVKIKKGTILQITGLRDEWPREKLLQLKRSLEKLINPNQKNDALSFGIYLHAPSEKDEDKKATNNQEPWNVVNGKVSNFIFEELKLKTTQITTSISEDGKQMKTRLEDRGTMIYELVEDNPYSRNDEVLQSVSMHLFALNRAAKMAFTKHMGIRAVDFGSVFLYKNGFRIYPFGSEYDDSLGISARKQQGTSRRLGTRDLIGRIEIDGDNPEFQETSSRDGGLIKNESYYLLQEYAIDTLKRLEKYVIGVIKWGNTGEIEDWKSLSQGELKSKITELIVSISGAKGVKDIRYDEAFLDVVNDVSEKSLKRVLKNFHRIADQTDNDSLSKEVSRAEARLEELSIASKEAEQEAETERSQRLDAESEARRAEEEALKAMQAAEKARSDSEQLTSESIFLRSIVTTDITNIVSLHHHVGIAAGTIEQHIKNLYRRLKSGKATSPEMIMEILQKISFQARQISSVTKFATKANFNAEAASTDGDVLGYIREYALNVCRGMFLTADGKDALNIKWSGEDSITFMTHFRPLEVAILVDNLLSNARKAGASEVEFLVHSSPDSVIVDVLDDGKGLGDSPSERLFQVGYSTSSGSGLGLAHIQRVVAGIGGTVKIANRENRGAVLSMELPNASGI